MGTVVRFHVLAFVALPLLVCSCSRSLPTAPHAGGESVRGGADLFATAGLENQVVVTLAPGVDGVALAQQYGAVLADAELGERTAALRPVTGQTPAALMAQLSVDARIETAEPNGWLEPAEARQQSFAFDDGFGSPDAVVEQPAFGALHVDGAHDVATGKGVKVAIIDTGADLTHPLLKGSIVGGWDFIGNDSDPTDVRDFIDNNRNGSVDEAFGHGTHVAGIVHMVAPDAKLLIVRVLDADGRGDIVTVAAGVRWAVAHGAKVINLSLGATNRADALQHTLADAEAAGVTVVTTAGNSSTDRVDFPGLSSHAVCVAAVDANGVGAPFSSFGSSVELSAPGVAIRSTYPGGLYRLWSGTSMSAPFVTGAVALLAELHPTWTKFDMEARLDATVKPIGTPLPNLAQANEFGSGVLDIGAALAPDFVPLPESPPETIRPH